MYYEMLIYSVNECILTVFEFVLQTERAQIRTQIHTLSVENKNFRSVLDEKRKEMEPLQQALGKLRGSSGVRERGSDHICTSESELNAVVSIDINIFLLV